MTAKDQPGASNRTRCALIGTVSRMAAGAEDELFPRDVEEEFRSCEADYLNDSGDESQRLLELNSSSDEEGSEADLHVSDSEASTDSEADPVYKATKLETRRIKKFVRESCGCKLGPKQTSCSLQFTGDKITEQRERCVTLEKGELDMLVLGQLQAHTKDTDGTSTQRKKYVELFFEGKRICRKLFMFLHTLSLKRYRNLLLHYTQNGITPREHGNAHKAPHNRVAFNDVIAIVKFIETYAEVHAMPLPGRLPNHKSKALLLPSDCSKSELYRQYVHACTLDSKKAVSWGKFHSLWTELLPHIDTMRPASDLCLQCQNNATLILQSANLSEEEKSEKLKAAGAHLTAAKGQREYYNTQSKTAKDEWESYRQGTDASYTGTMHYSFDYAQNVSYPSNPQQPGPAYFKSARKCGVFGVTCEPLSFQVNYLIDENDDPGKGANATVSMLHHFLDSHSVHEEHLKLHADNCVGQNKNNILMQYLMWRLWTGRNKTIEISFMLTGHTKFAPDRFFGVLKKRYRHTFVSTLDELVDVVKKSMVCGQNIPQLTKNSQRRLVKWYDWKSYLSTYFRTIPAITTYHHFRFDQRFPELVFARSLADSPEEAIKIAHAKNACDDLPTEISPKGMDLSRQWYLYDEIRQFCSSPEAAQLTCPRPKDPKPSTAAKQNAQPSDSTTGKRKRTCSHCHEEGHTKTKRGKIACPKLL